MHSIFKQIALSLAVTLSLSAQNKFENPGFEKGAARWDFFIPDSNKDHGNTLTIEPHTGLQGGNAAKIVLPVASRCAIAQKNIPVTGWTRYRVSFWFKADKGAVYTVGPLLRLNFRGSRENPDETDIYVGLGGYTGSDPSEVKRPNWLPSEWEKVEAVIESPMNAAFVSVGLFAWQMKGTVYFDEVSLAVLAEPAP